MKHRGPHTITGEAGPCFECGQPCYPVQSGYFRHGMRCGEPMAYAEGTCARRAGHGYEHRSAYAMENAARTRTGRGLRALVAA